MAESPMRIAFAGTPQFSVPTLRSLVEAGHQVVSVWTQPDRPAGRGRKLQLSPVKTCALELDLAVRQPDNLKDGTAVEQLERDSIDLLVVVAFGMILPQQVLDLPKHGCWNVHASLLPRWRGAAPIQRAIEAGDAMSGTCVMEMEAGLDTGPVLACSETAIDDTTTAGDLHDTLSEQGAALLVDCVNRLRSGEDLPAVPQDHTKATYANKLSKAETPLDFNEAAITLQRRIRAFNPWPVTTATIADMTLRVFASEVLPNRHESEIGSIIGTSSAGVDIACGQGTALRLLQVQRPGGRRISGGDLANQLR
ncbi:MAG: methionyl-tRNA formyltransferase [Lysobacteraceae bacterium]|nr:MAG: methionyl-tRNA formyltransferase [Xanthomonadaceae bacterium]